MGFLQAVHSLGEMSTLKAKDSPLADIMSFLQLPYSLTTNKTRKTNEANKSSKTNETFAIRLWLEVEDPESDVLEIKGINYIDRIEYQAIGDQEGDQEIKIKELCLYRDPVGSNVSWRFSPLYKLGKGEKEPVKALLGEDKNWPENKKCRFYKLYHTVLKDYENSGYFTKGSTDRIMADLVKEVEKIAEFWSDRKNSCLLIFGIKVGNKFLYPGEIPAFVSYFKSKLNQKDSKITSNNSNNTYCALCGERGRKQETLDKVFKFATFDKPGFLPGTKDVTGIREKTFPICENCYAVLSAGKEAMENNFVNLSVIPNVNLYVIPEIISDKQKYYRKAADFTKDFLTKGIRHETSLFSSLARHEEGLVYHFLFAEINQAQLIVHSLIEDVPPSRLKQLENSWQRTCSAFSPDKESDNESKRSLDSALKQIVAVFLSLAGKRDQDRAVMRDKVIAVISALLSGEQVKTYEIKALIVSRLMGLYTDHDWIRPKDKKEMSGRQKMKGMAEVVDFLSGANRG